MKITVADAFASAAFGGNPAAVCVLAGPASEAWMQRVAAEMNLSETAYVYRLEDGDYSLRWFTPEAEVDLCGHATLASAHVLWEEGHAEEAELRFRTKSGLLTATRDGDRIRLDFPSEPAVRCEDTDSKLSDSLGGVPLMFVGRNRIDYLVEVESESVLRGLRPEFALMKRLGERGLIVTSRADDPAVDFVSRCFFPAIGIDEDPVTGSAHCCLAPYWGERLNKSELTAVQASRREGSLTVRLAGGDRVHLLGRAITTLRGELSPAGANGAYSLG